MLWYKSEAWWGVIIVWKHVIIFAIGMLGGDVVEMKVGWFKNE